MEIFVNKTHDKHLDTQLRQCSDFPLKLLCVMRLSLSNSDA